MTGTIAFGLMLTAASCGSDKKSTATTAPTAISTAVGAVSIPAAAGLDPIQAKVLAQTITLATAAGVTIDAPCLTAVLAQMSDADAQLIIDAGPAGKPTLSAAGEALSPAAAACASVTPTPST